MEEYENLIRQYLVDRGWDNLRPVDLAKSVSIESAELLEIFQWSNQTLDEVKNDSEKIEEIKNELADVLIYCLDMSVLLNLNTGEIIKNKLSKVKKKYPVDVIKNDGSKEPGTESEYLKIKHAYRADKRQKENN